MTTFRGDGSKLDNVEKTEDLEKMVEFLWDQCVCKEKDAYERPNNLVGRGKLNKFAYNKNQITYYQPVIAFIGSILRPIDEEARYHDLACENNGERWTEFYFKVEKAVSLLNASGLLEFCHSSKDWDSVESRNPKIRIKK